MKLEQIFTHVGNTPYMMPEYGRIIYDFILDHAPNEILELGFAHGTSSCYLAGALHQLGRGHLTSVDIPWSATIKPTIEEQLQRSGLDSYVTVQRERSSYTWFLKKQIEHRTCNGVCQPLYDFCFIDGGKHWTSDGAAFFMVDKLLNQNGWILFDDYSWTHSEYQRIT